MTFALHPIHAFQPQVEALKARVAAAGLRATHATLLQRVAQDHGKWCWDELPTPSHGLLARCMGWGASWKRQSTVKLDELLFDTHCKHLRLGLTANRLRREPVVQGFQQHILIVGPNGAGAASAYEYYAAQQLARDGGLLVLDTLPDDHSPDVLAKVAQACGRTDFKRYRHDRPDGEVLEDLAPLVKNAGVAYVSLPGHRHGEYSRRTADALIKQLEAIGRGFAAEPSTAWPHPFTVMVPDAGALLTEAWLPLVQNARAYNIQLVVRLQTVTDLKRVSSELAQGLLAFDTKVLLAPGSAEPLEVATKTLVSSKDRNELTKTRAQLAKLRLGSALVARGTSREVVRLCVLEPKTRAEDLAQRMG